MPTSVGGFSGRSSVRRGLVAALVVASAYAPVALGQDIRGDSTTRSLDFTLRSGRLLGSPSGSGIGGGGGGVSQLGFVNSGSAASARSFGGGVAPSAPSFGGVRALGGGGVSLMVPFSRTSSMQYYAGPAFNGRGAFYVPPRPVFSTSSSANIIAEDRMAVFLGSFHHRLYSKLEGGAIRDQMTNETLANPYDDAGIDYSAPRKTHAEYLAERLDAKFDRYVSQGWTSMRQGEFWRGAQDFDNAILLHPDALDPLVGRILSAAADRRTASAVAYLETVAPKRDDLFTIRRPLADTLDTAARGSDLLQYLSAVVDAYPDDDGYAGLYVYLLWLDGRDSEALSSADALRISHRTSPFAVFADQIRQQIDPRFKSDTGDDLELRALSRAER